MNAAKTALVFLVSLLSISAYPQDTRSSYQKRRNDLAFEIIRFAYLSLTNEQQKTVPFTSWGGVMAPSVRLGADFILNQPGAPKEPSEYEIKNLAKYGLLESGIKWKSIDGYKDESGKKITVTMSDPPVYYFHSNSKENFYFYWLKAEFQSGTQEVYLLGAQCEKQTQYGHVLLYSKEASQQDWRTQIAYVFDPVKVDSKDVSLLGGAAKIACKSKARARPFRNEDFVGF